MRIKGVKILVHGLTLAESLFMIHFRPGMVRFISLIGEEFFCVLLM